MYPYIFTTRDGAACLTILIAGKSHNLDASHPNFTRVTDAIKAGDWDAVPGLVDIPAAVNAFGAGKVTVRDGVVYYGAEPVRDSLADRILSMAGQGFSVDPFCRLMENIQANPSFRLRQRIFDFLDALNLPITDDGCFMAYKKVRRDTASGGLVDIHSGKFSNDIGTVVEMDRTQVDDRDDVTCSAGLHVCSESYLPHFGNDEHDEIILVKVDPRDVVSIPTDYNNAKMRTCRYTVMALYEGDYADLVKRAAVVTDGDFYVADDDYDGEDDYNYTNYLPDED
jgi:hypothetical protein